MACISKLSAGFAYNCDSGATGLLDALIINKEDITGFTYDSINNTHISSIGLAPGATAYKIDTPKRTLIATEALKVNENAPNAFAQTVTITVTGNTVAAKNIQYIVNSAINGSFVVIVRDTSRIVRVYGLYYGLSVSAVDRSSADNGGWYTVTLSTPEQVIGEDPLTFAPAMYATMYGAAVY